MKNLFLIFTFFLFSFFLKLNAQCTLDKSNWQLVFNEEFDEANTTDLLAHGWALGNPGFISNPERAECLTSEGICTQWECYDINQISLVNTTTPPAGFPNSYAIFNKTITPTPFLCNSNYTQIKAAEIYSTYSDFDQSVNAAGVGMLYGMVEIRCKLPQAISSYSAFWLDGIGWPPEMDLFETHGDGGAPDLNYFFSTIHWNDNPITCPYASYTHSIYNCACTNYYHPSAYHLSDDFHTWTIVWTPEKVTFFFDGIELKTDNDVTHLPWYNEFYDVSTGALKPSPDIANLIRWFSQVSVISGGLQCADLGASYDPLIVDYVKIYKPNNYLSYFNYYTGYILPTYGYSYNDNNSYILYYNFLKNLYHYTTYKPSAGWRKQVIDTKDFIPVNVQGCLKGCQGGGKFFYYGLPNGVYSTYWDPSYGGFITGGLVGGSFFPPYNGHISVANNGGNVFFAFGNSVFSADWTGSSWTSNIIGADCMSEFISSESDGLNFVYKNLSGDLTYASRPTTTSTWTNTLVSVGGNVGSNLIHHPWNFYDLYYIDNTNNIYETDAAHGGGWQITTTGDVISDLAISPDISMNYFMYKDGSNKLKIVTAYVSGGMIHYNPPANFKAHMYGATIATDVDNVREGIIIGQDPSNAQYYYVGTDNSPWVVYWNGTDYTAMPMFSTNERSVAGDFHLVTISSAVPPPTDTRISYRGTDNKIRIIYWDNNCENLNPACYNFTDMTLMKASHQISKISDSNTHQSALNANNDFNNKDNNVTILNQSLENLLQPNPTYNVSYLNMNISEIKKMTLSSMDGRTKELPIILENGKIKIDLSEYNSGVYVVYVYTNSEEKTFKLVKY